jgi:tellurite resistance protein TehA-like permease
VGKEEQLQWERRWAPWAAAAAVAAALLPIAATIYASSLLGTLPNNREDLFLEKVHAHAGGYIASGVITAIGTFLVAPVLYYLYRVTLARRPIVPRVALILALAAPFLAGGIGVARQVVIAHTADQFAAAPSKPVTDAQRLKLQKITDANAYKKEIDKLGPTGVAKDKLQSGSVATVAYIGLIANLLLGTAFVLISMHAMRAGLLSRFMGILGVIVGALTAIPLLGGAPVVQLFWLVAMAALILDRWPQGRGPAWAAVEEVPWPTAQQRRDELGGGPPARGRGGRQTEPEPEDDADEPAQQHTREAVRPRPSAATHARSKKRKRKRRG